MTKNQKVAVAKVEKDKLYAIEEASALVKDTTTTKFDASVDIACLLYTSVVFAEQQQSSHRLGKW